MEPPVAPRAFARALDHRPAARSPVQSIDSPIADKVHTADDASRAPEPDSLRNGAKQLVALTDRERESTLVHLEVHDMVEVLRGNPSEVVIRVSGGFDERAGAQLARCIERLPKAKRVVIDFSRLTSFHDVDVGAVAKELAGLPDLSIRGLGRHHLRLLRYCGVHFLAGRTQDAERDD
jgi:hypothetical protein